MNKLNAPADLSDTESDQLYHKLNRIIQISDKLAQGQSAPGHEIYVLARDCRDLLVFDQQSREVMRKLSHSDTETYNGFVLNDTVKRYARSGRKIEAIKELRTFTGCGLKEAKDAVEAFLGEPSW